MNILEAVDLSNRCGAALKRKGWADFLTHQPDTECNHTPSCEPCLRFPDDVDPRFTAEDLTATDWVVDLVDGEHPSERLEEPYSAVIKPMYSVGSIVETCTGSFGKVIIIKGHVVWDVAGKAEPWTEYTLMSGESKWTVIEKSITRVLHIK